jgi:hypothetical protein
LPKCTTGCRAARRCIKNRQEENEIEARQKDEEAKQEDDEATEEDGEATEKDEKSRCEKHEGGQVGCSAN